MYNLQVNQLYTGSSVFDYPDFPPPGIERNSLIAEMCPGWCIGAGARAPCARAPSPPPLSPPSSPPTPAIVAVEAAVVGGSDGIGVSALVGIALGCLMLVAFCGALVCAQQHRAKLRAALQSQADRMGLQTPTAQWRAGAKYAAFLSHFKMEAGSDARFLREVLMKMLGTNVFLDSADLTDLRLLMTEGVRQSDVLVILGTASVLTRPFCLLEIFEAVQQGIPVEIVQVASNPLDVDAAFELVDHLEEQLDALNPGAFEQLVHHLGRRRIKLLKAALRSCLETCTEQGVLTWHPHASDAHILANGKDICEALARDTEQELVWAEPDGRRLSSHRTRSSEKASTERSARLGVVTVSDGGHGDGGGVAADGATASGAGATMVAATFVRKLSRRSSESAVAAARKATLFLSFAPSDAGSDARVLQAALFQLQGKPVIHGHGGNAAEHREARAQIGECRALVLLQTPGTLLTAGVLLDLWEAVQQAKPIIPVVVDGQGQARYDFEAASGYYAHLETELRARGLLGDVQRELAEGGPRQSEEGRAGERGGPRSCLVVASWLPRVPPARPHPPRVAGGSLLSTHSRFGLSPQESSRGSPMRSRWCRA